MIVHKTETEGERVRQCYRPSPVGERARHVGEEVAVATLRSESMVRRRRAWRRGIGGASRHLQRAHDRIGSFGLAVGAVAVVNLVSSPWPPPFSFIALSDRAH
jgi:hypothetical protein